MQTFTLSRVAEDANSTSGQLLDEAGKVLVAILEGGKATPGHTRIPAGTFPLQKKNGWSKFDARYRRSFPSWYQGMVEVAGVPDRSDILIHTGNTFGDSEGCLLAGLVIVKGKTGFEIPAGASMPAFNLLYPLLYRAINQGETQMIVRDIGQP